MTGPRVDPANPSPAVLSGDQWSAAQSAPLSALQSGDPIKATTNGYGRALSGDEWAQSQRMTPDQIRSWKIPALPMPTFQRDVTKTPADPTTKGKKIETPIVGALMRQLVDPTLEYAGQAAPFLALTVPGVATEAPALAIGGAVVAGATAVHTIARYGWQKAQELGMSPDERAKAEADPGRVSGEAAAVQAAMLGLAPLIHVGSRSVAEPPRYLDTPNAARDVTAPQRADALARSDFAAQLESGAQNALPVDVRPLKGLEPTSVGTKTPRSVQPVEGLEVPEAVKAGRVKPIETQPADAELQQRADVDQARRDYEAQRVAEDQADLAAARQADAERVLGLREPEKPDMTPRRRAGGQKAAPFFETPTGAETLGATAARHGLPEDANPYHPDSSLAPEWQAGHDNATQSYPVFPEGFSMGGALTDNRIPGAAEIPATARGTNAVEGLQTNAPPEGSTPESAQLAAALKPSRFRGHSTDDLTQIAVSARRTIEADPESPTATRAKGTLAQVELEFAMRGITGDDLAKRIAGETPQAGGSLTPVEGTGPTRTRGLSASIAQRLGDAIGDVPQYQQVSMAEQADRATALLLDDPVLARRVALGDAPPPHNLLPESVLVAVEQQAIAEGDVATLRDLASSKLSRDATTMGQRIRALGERDPDSPVKAIQDVVNKRSGGDPAKVAKASEAELATIRAAIDNTPIEHSAWTSFVDSLKC